MAEHDVFIDRAGWGNYPRLTCLVCNETIVKQPYMTVRQWIEKAKEFGEKHSCSSVENYLNLWKELLSR